MNKIHSIFWNARLGRYTIASEHAKPKTGVLTKVSTVAFITGVVGVFGIFNVASAGVAIADGGASVGGGAGTSYSSTGGYIGGAFASWDAIAMVGDGDCAPLAAATLTNQGLYGTGVNHTGGIYGLGQQKTQNTGYTGYHAGGTGMGAINSYTSTGIFGTDTMGGRAGSSATQAFGLNSAAIGCAAKAYGFGAYALGMATLATGTGSTALGLQSQATGNGSVAAGVGSVASGEDSIAMSALSTASGVSSMALGKKSQATGDSTVAIGDTAMASFEASVALGRNAIAASVSSLALGDAAQANGASSVALGANSIADRDNTVSVGSSSHKRQITNVAIGTEAADAVAVQQLTDAVALLGGGVAVTNGVINAPAYLIGKNTVAGAVSAGTTHATVGAALSALDVASVKNLNDINTANTLITTNKGISDKGIADNTALINKNQTDTNAVIATNKAASELADSNLNTLIATNKTAAELADTNINIRVDKASENMLAIAQNLGSTGAVDGNGHYILPTYSVGSNVITGTAATIHTTVKSAIAALDTASISNLNEINAIKQDIAGVTGNSLVKQAGVGQNITVGAAVTGLKVDFKDSASKTRVLTGVAPGELSVTSVDAVNGTQLNATNLAVTANTSLINKNQTDTNAVIATNKTASELADTNINTLITTNKGISDKGIADNTALINVTTDLLNTNKITTDAKIESNRVTAIALIDANKLVTDATITANKTEAENLVATTKTVTDATIAANKLNAEALIADNAALIAENTTSISINAADILANKKIAADATLVNKGLIDNTKLATDATIAANKINAEALISANTDLIAVNAADILANKKIAADASLANTTLINTNKGLADTAITQVGDRITEIVNNMNTGAIGLVTQADASADIKVAGNSLGAKVDFKDSASKSRILTGVANGVAGSDAVNFSQLSDTNTAVAANTAGITTNTADIVANKKIAADATLVNKGLIDANTSAIADNTSTIESNKTAANIAIAANKDLIDNTKLATDATIAANKINAEALISANTDLIAVNAADILANKKIAADASLANTTLINTNKGLADTAITQVGDRITEILNNMNTGAIGLVTQSDTSADIKVAGNSLGAKVDFKDSASKSRILTGVANGVVGSDAVNFAQLSDTNTAVAANTAGITTNTADIVANKKIAADATLANKGLIDANTSAIESNKTAANIAIAANKDLIDNTKLATDATIAANKTTAMNAISANTDLIGVNAADILANKKIAADATLANKGLIDANTSAIESNKTAANIAIAANKDLIDNTKLATDATIAENKTTAMNAISANTDLIGVNAADILANKKIAADASLANTTLINTNKGLADTAITQVGDRITEIVNNMNTGVIGLVTQSDASADIKVAGNSLGAKVDFKDSASKSRILTGVANGVAGSDAVNFSQLSDTNTAVAANTAGITTNTADILANKKIAADATLVNKGLIDANTSAIAGNTSTIESNKTAANIAIAANKDLIDNTKLATDATIAANKTTAMNAISANTDLIGVNAADIVANKKIAADASLANTTLINTNKGLADTAITQVGDRITEIVNNMNTGVIGLVTQSDASADIKVAGNSLGAKVDFKDSASKSRILTGVANGVVGSDAVNFAQLSDTNTAVAANTAGITTNTADIVANKKIAADATLANKGLIDANTSAIESNKTAANIAIAANKDLIDNTKLATDATIAANKINAEALISANTDLIAVNAADILANKKIAADASLANTTLINTNKGLADTAITQVGDRITEIVNNMNTGAIGLVTQADASADIKVAGNSLGAKVDFKDSASKSRILTGVANGVAGSDAVNFSQLSDTNVAVTANTTAISNNAAAISTNSTDILANKKIAADATLVNKGLIDANTSAIADNTSTIESNKTAANIAIAANKDLIDNTKLATDATIAANKTTAMNAISANTDLIAVNAADILANKKIAADASLANTTLINTNKGLADTAITQVGDRITEIVNNMNTGVIGLVTQADASADIKVAGNSLGAKVDFKDSASKSRILTGVANGVAGSDAVNFSQLSDTNVAVTANTTAISTNSTDILANKKIAADATLVNKGLIDANTSAIAGNTNAIESNKTAANIAIAANKTNIANNKMETDAAIERTDETVAVNSALIKQNKTLADAAISRVDQRVARTTANAEAIMQNVGGDLAIDGNGDFVAPTYLVGKNSVNGAAGTVYTNIKSALSGIDKNVVANTNTLDALQVEIATSLENALVKQANPGASINVGGASKGTQVSFINQDGDARILTGVANGGLYLNSTDAVNGGQLNATNLIVSENKASAEALNTTTNEVVAKNKLATDVALNSVNTRVDKTDLNVKSVMLNLGGASAINAEGDFVAPSYVIGANALENTTSQVFTTVHSAIAAIDTAVVNNTNTMNNIQTEITNITQGSVGLVKQADNRADVIVAGNSKGANVIFSDKDGVSRVLKGVANGELSVTSTDAVNGAQLHETNAQVQANSAETALKFTAMNTRVDGNTNNLVAVMTNLGGTAAVDAAGSFIAPTYLIGKNAVTGAAGNAHTTVVGALADIDTTVTSTVNSLTEITNIINSGTLGLVSFDSANNRVVVAGALAGDSVDFAGTAGSRILTGVAAGRGNTDAANVGQLRDVYETIGGTINADGTITGPTFTVQNQDLNLKDSISLLDTIVGRIDTQITSSVHYDKDNVNSITLGGSLGRTIQPVSIKNLANGVVASGSLDAVNGGQLYEVSQRIQESVEGLVQVDKEDVNRVNVAAAQTGTVIDIAGAEGDRIISGVKDGVADNDAATIGQIKDLILTTNINYADSGMVSVKNTAKYANASTEGENSLSVGAGSVASANNAISVGTLSVASGDTAMAMGVKALATAEKSIAMGAESRAVGESSVALGHGAQGLARNSVALGAGSIADRENTVSVGSTGAERQITNVAAGTVGTDAVNVNQLNAGLSNVYSQNEARIQTLDKKINKMDKRVNGGIASAMAVAGIVQNPIPGGSSIGGAIYGFGDQAAMAIGVSSVSKDGHWSVKVAGTVTADGKVGGGAGVSYNW